MTSSRELVLECRLRLIKYMEKNSVPDDPIDLWVAGFWAAVEAFQLPRNVADLEMELRRRRSEANQPVVTMTDPVVASDTTLMAEVMAEMVEARQAERARRLAAPRTQEQGIMVLQFGQEITK